MKKVLIETEMRNLIKYNLILLFCFYQNVFSIENKILFKVDDELITSIDIYNKSKYLTALDPDIKNLSQEEIFELSKNLLIREKIKKITINKEEIDLYTEDKILNSYIKSIFSSKNINNLQDYKNFTKNLDLNFDTMRDSLIIEILWNNLIFKKYSSKIKINKDELRNEIKNLQNQDIVSYLLSEIVFQASNKSEIQVKFNEIKSDIQKQGFKQAAFMHSIADSSGNGGDIGWINQNSLNKKVLKIVNNLNIGEISEPILIPSGFLILMLEEKKNSKRKLDVDTELNDLIRLRTNQQLNQYSNIFFNKIKKEIQINAF